MNALGSAFRLSLFGESHGHVVGVLVDGVPAGVPFSEEDVQPALDRRRPGQSGVTTPRAETDDVSILSGCHEGHTTGAPVLMLVHNQDKDSSKYVDFLARPRPGHADLTARAAYLGWSDHRGGGMFSGRLTAGIVMAGALARRILSRQGIEVAGHVRSVGEVRAPQAPSIAHIREHVETNPVRAVFPDEAKAMEELILACREDRDSVGGTVECLVEGLPPGLGDPIFDKVESVLARAMMSLPATKGVQFGRGFAASAMRGSAHNDPFRYDEAGRIRTTKNDGGGVLGGVTTGMPLVVEVAFKPASSIAREQETIDLGTGEPATLSVEGRHDPCVVPRAVPVVEAMMASALTDLILLRRMRGHGSA